jgi:Asp-tRNA(Asn)/Glu-tRNA(Gln) amidotransferase A subunit family amidase
MILAFFATAISHRHRNVAIEVEAALAKEPRLAKPAIELARMIRSREITSSGMLRILIRLNTLRPAEIHAHARASHPVTWAIATWIAELVDSCIEQLTRVSPKLNAIVHRRFDAARKEAKEVDLRVSSTGHPVCAAAAPFRPQL